MPASGVVHLANAGHLRLHIPARARSDVAIDTGHARVRRSLVGHELGVHHGVAQLAAELHRIGELVRLVAADRADQREDHHEAEDKGHGAALRRIVEIELREMGRHTYGAKPAPPLDHHSDRYQNQAEDQKARRHHVGENADVGRWVAGENVNQNQENDVDEATAASARPIRLIGFLMRFRETGG